MSFDFKATLKADGTVHWHGLDTGRTEVTARNNKLGVIAMLIHGHHYFSGIGQPQQYEPNKFVVLKFRPLENKREDGSELIEVEFFGDRLQWYARKPWRRT